MGGKEMTALKVVFCVAGVLLLAGCNETVKIEDGKIPLEYLSVAEQLVGDYEGDSRAEVLSLNLQGDKMVMSYHDGFSDDLLDPRCESGIGDLVEIKVSGSKEEPKEEPEIKSAIFEFFSNRCAYRVEGKNLYLSFKKKKGQLSIKVQLLEELVCHSQYNSKDYNLLYYPDGYGDRLCPLPRFYWIKWAFTRDLN